MSREAAVVRRVKRLLNLKASKFSVIVVSAGWTRALCREEVSL
jgi:hypothetical protein